MAQRVEERRARGVRDSEKKTAVLRGVEMDARWSKRDDGKVEKVDEAGGERGKAKKCVLKRGTRTERGGR